MKDKPVEPGAIQLLLRLDFNRRLPVQFRGSAVTSDAGFLLIERLDDALGLSAMAGKRSLMRNR
jgi:hypothetical protein